jgi:hypothetical protein
MTTRFDIEQAILDEESMLEQVAGLLERQASIAMWSDPAPAGSRTASAHRSQVR